ncbi:MAG: SRPBCC domain-containing protein [Propionibacteriaceae bacterium]|nr:SRPBCC domain-containing protein [Propionibacteriaceae bacterium]
MTESVTDTQTSVTTVVSRVVEHPAKSVWAVLLSAAGQAELLGEGASLGDKGDTWKASDGTWGITRSYHPCEEMRFSWHKNEDSPRTWVEISLTQLAPAQTKIQISHDHAHADFDVAALTAHWEAALEYIDREAK